MAFAIGDLAQRKPLLESETMCERYRENDCLRLCALQRISILVSGDADLPFLGVSSL